MEKRRRARINDSLNHLKNLILPLTGRDVSYYIVSYTSVSLYIEKMMLNISETFRPRFLTFNYHFL